MCKYSSQEAADALGVTVMTIHRWVSKDLISPEYIGIRRILRFSRDELERFAAEQQVAINLPEKS